MVGVVAGVQAVLNGLIPFIDLGKGWLDRRAEAKQAKHEAHMEWLRTAATERRFSWKDEYVLVITSYPIISVFIPWFGVRENTFESLELLGQLPDWLVWSWLVMVYAIYGAVKFLDKIKLGK